MKRRTRAKNNIRKWVERFFAILVVVIVLLLGALTIRELYYRSIHVRNGQYTDNGGAADEIKYKGDNYKYNKNIRTILLLGLDCEKMGDKVQSEGLKTKGPRSDTMILLIINKKAKSLKIFPISRDSIVPIDVFDYSGEFQHTVKEHLCLQYAFAGGGKKSGEYTSKAVSNMLYGIRIDEYLAVDQSTVKVLADMVGGVSVTALETLYDDDGKVRFTEGEEYDLKGQDALDYVRLRYRDHSGGNDRRMERQRQFVAGFLEKYKKMVKADPKMFFRSYKMMKPHMETSINALDVAGLFLTMRHIKLSEAEYLCEPGETRLNVKSSHDEFYIDDERMYEMVLENFYTKIK